MSEKSKFLEITVIFEGDIDENLARLLMKRAASFADEAGEDLCDETRELFWSVSGAISEDINIEEEESNEPRRCVCQYNQHGQKELACYPECPKEEE